MRTTSAILLLFAVTPLLAQGQDRGGNRSPTVESANRAVRRLAQLVDRGEYTAAISAAPEAIKLTRAGRDAQGASAAYFYLGRAYYGAGRKDESREAYKNAVMIDSKNGAAFNNLARLELEAGDLAQAKFHTQAAIALNTSRRPYYLVNLGDILVKMGNHDEALTAYESATRADEQNAEAESKYFAELAILNQLRLATAMERSLSRGHVTLVQDEALRYIQSDSFSEETRGMMLAVVAESLEKQHLTKDDFLKSPIGERLAEIAASGSDVSAGARDIIHLYKIEMLAPLRDGWWREWAEPFVNLAHALGADARDAGRLAEAEARFRLTLEMTEGRDPDALVDLADFYYSQRNIKAIDELLRTYESFLQSTATLLSDARSLYRLHYALGTIYAHAGKWGSSDEPASAIYQLEHARDKALKTKPSDEDFVQVDAKVIDLLATGYEKTDVNKAVKFRLDWAETFVSEQRVTSAQKVLQPYGESLPETVPPEDVRRYRNLRVAMTSKIKPRPPLPP